jgi:hypothetical protein
MKVRRWVIALCVLALGVGFTGGPAFADPPKAKCNSGNGNLFETDPANDCDPGNSAGHNNGGG